MAPQGAGPTLQGSNGPQARTLAADQPMSRFSASATRLTSTPAAAMATAVQSVWRGTWCGCRATRSAVPGPVCCTQHMLPSSKHFSPPAAHSCHSCRCWGTKGDHGVLTSMRHLVEGSSCHHAGAPHDMAARPCPSNHPQSKHTQTAAPSETSAGPGAKGGGRPLPALQLQQGLCCTHLCCARRKNYSRLQ
jgi:hypothetical protein